MDTEPEKPAPRYDGPLDLGHALSLLGSVPLTDANFVREGLRADVEYRDLGLAAATGGRIGAKHIRAIRPFDRPTGWHWHDMTGHFVYVLKGWIAFRFAGVGGEVTVKAGSCLSQPAGVAHNVVGRSDDLELIEINMPAEYATSELDAPVDAPQP
ncbi:MAG: cupin domain-containing protein [Proteobacteria bacterium]|nr:cupin domain-containing protein [Pseudomonadota bacterium]